MAPDANKHLANVARENSTASLNHQPKLQYQTENDDDFIEDAVNASLECVLQPRILTDFSYVENPIRCMLSCNSKFLACNGKSAVFLKKNGDNSQNNSTTTTSAEALGDEFVLIPENAVESVFLLQNSKTQQFLCSSKEGGVYATRTRSKEGFEKWIMVEYKNKADEEATYQVASEISGRVLASSGHTVHTIKTDDKSSNNNIMWNLTLTSGELCFVTLPIQKQQLRCNLMGSLSLSDNFMGCEAWRISSAGGDASHVRITPWAHANFCLSSTAGGNVITTEDRGPSDIWKVSKAPNGLHGVILESVEHQRILKYNPSSDDQGGSSSSNNSEDSFITIPRNMLMVDENCVWDFSSLHQRTYYLATGDGKKRLEAPKKRSAANGLTLRGLPNRVQSEEWEVQPISEMHTVTNSITGSQHQAGVVRLFSAARQHYLASNENGDVSLMTSNDDNSNHVDQLWIIEEREDGFLIRAHATQRVLVSQDKDKTLLSTVPSGTMVRGNTRWRLEPKIPRQVNKEKLQAVGGAVAIGVIGTVATPFILGAAVGALGIAQVGIAGNICIGSVRAVEAINTITRVTMSSSQLMIRQSSSISSSMRKKGDDGNKEEDDKDSPAVQRRYSDWRSWK